MTTATLDVPGATEAVAGLALAAGTTYMLEVDGDWPVRLIETDSASAPAGPPRGHVLYPGREHRQPDRLSYRAAAGLYLWAVPLGPATRLVGTEQ